MKNILFILPFLPYPLKSGGHQAIFNGIKALIGQYNIFITYDELWYESNLKYQKEMVDKLGKSVTFLPFKIHFSLKYPPPFTEKIVVFFWKIYNKLKNKNKTFEKINTNYFEPPSSIKISYLNTIIRQYNISIAQCEMLSTIQYGSYLSNAIKKIFVHHELGFVRKELEMQTNTESALTPNFFLETFKQQEIQFLNKFDKVITLSEIDSQKLIHAGVTVPIHSSFAIVNTSIEKIHHPYNPNLLTFLGPSSHEPNVVGLTWFLDNCWNLLIKANPSIQLQILGNWDNSYQKSFKSKYSNIKFLGYVNDIKAHLSGTIMIIPITIGSGIRMKILEAAACGVPIVTTSIGIEGIPATSGKDYLQADSPEDFINCISSLNNIEFGNKIAENLKKIVETNYSFVTFKKNRCNLYENL